MSVPEVWIFGCDNFFEIFFCQSAIISSSFFKKLKCSFDHRQSRLCHIALLWLWALFSQIEFVTTWWLSLKFLKQNYQKVEMSPFCAYYIKATKGGHIIINFHVITISFTITQLIQYLILYIQFKLMSYKTIFILQIWSQYVYNISDSQITIISLIWSYFHIDFKVE